MEFDLPYNLCRSYDVCYCDAWKCSIIENFDVPLNFALRADEISALLSVMPRPASSRRELIGTPIHFLTKSICQFIQIRRENVKLGEGVFQWDPCHAFTSKYNIIYIYIFIEK